MFSSNECLESKVCLVNAYYLLENVFANGFEIWYFLINKCVFENVYMLWSLFDLWNDLKGKCLKYVLKAKYDFDKWMFGKRNVLTNECFDK